VTGRVSIFLLFADIVVKEEENATGDNKVELEVGDNEEEFEDEEDEADEEDEEEEEKEEEGRFFFFFIGR